MFPALKSAFVPLIALALVVGAGVALQSHSAQADIGGGASSGVWFLENYGDVGDTLCTDGDPRDIRLFGNAPLVNHIWDNDPTDDPQVIQIASNDDLIMCVEPNDPTFNVVFDTTGDGGWTEAYCGNLGTECIDEEGVGDDALTVVRTTNPPLDLIAITFDCNGASVQTITIRQDDAFAGAGDEIVFRIMCKGFPANMSLSAVPTTVESSPATGNTSYALIRAVITDAAGNPVLPSNKVDVSTTGCGISTAAVDTLDERNEVLFNAGTGTHDGLNLAAINAEFDFPPLVNFLDILAFGGRDLPQAGPLNPPLIEVDTNAAPDTLPDDADGVPNHSEALVLFHAAGCDAGVYTVTFEINNPKPAADLETSVDITVIGPPAFITVSAAPTELICGEKSEITVTATDINNRAVSDNTRIEVLTNWGGVFGGTGTSLTTPQPVNPLSSTTVELFDGIGIAFLLTSVDHHGPYEVLAASTAPQFGTSIEDSQPVVAQVTVTCTLAELTEVLAPDTGTGAVGPIRPPNTGDSGLAAGTVGSGTLLAIVGAALGVLAVIARRRLPIS